MALLAPNVDYTDVDFDSLRARLIALLESVFPDWSDHDVAAFGELLVEMYAFVGDVLGYYLDNHAHESRLVTATQRKSVIALAQMLGYRLGGAQAAVTEVQLRLGAIPTSEVLVKAGTVVRTEGVTEPVRFQLLEDVRLPPGMEPPEVLARAEHSRTHEKRFDVRGLPDLDLVLDRTPYLDGSARVSAANGDYVEVPNLLGSGPNDRHFVILVDQNDRATLRFGDGISGAPPTGTVHVVYKIGGGGAGRVEAGRLTVIEGSFSDAAGRPVQVFVTNPFKAEGGFDRETIASAKVKAPEGLRALTRSVAREDFEINARRLPGVARALMLTSDEDRSIEENAGILFVVPVGGGLPTPALKAQVLRQITDVYPHTLTFQPAVQDPVYRRVDVRARVFFPATHSTQAQRLRVAGDIRQRLRDHFRITNPDGTPNRAIDFGFNVKDADGLPSGEIALSDVFNVVRDTPRVRKIGDRPEDFTLDGRHADIRLTIKQFPVLGSVEIVDGDTGGLL